MIVKYKVLNPVVDTKRPFFDAKRGLLFFPANGKHYRHYVECKQIYENGTYDYIILISETKKFDTNCRLCNVDPYGRCKINLRGELKEYVKEEAASRGNIDVIYQRTEDDYDVLLIR